MKKLIWIVSVTALGAIFSVVSGCAQSPVQSRMPAEQCSSRAANGDAASCVNDEVPRDSDGSHISPSARRNAL